MQLFARQLRVENEFVLEGIEGDQWSQVLTGVGVVRGRREGQVEGQLEAQLSHIRNDAVEEGTGTLQAGVGVDFDEPGLEIGIDHEIQSEDLEVVHEIARRYLGEDAAHCIRAHLPHLWQDLLLEVVLLGGQGSIQVSLELLIRYLVEGLVLVVVGEAFLDCIVGEVYFWLKGVDVELVGGSSDVALLVPVGPGDSEEVGNHHVVPDVEFTVAVQQWSVDVHLHYVGPFLLLIGVPTPFSLLDEGVELIYFVDDSDASPLVAILARLDYPDIAHLVLRGAFLFLLPPLLLDHPLPPLVEVDELDVLRVLRALLDVEGQRNVVVEIVAAEGVVLTQVVEEGLLVAQEEVVDEVVVNQPTVLISSQDSQLLVDPLHAV